MTIVNVSQLSVIILSYNLMHVPAKEMSHVDLFAGTPIVLWFDGMHVIFMDKSCCDMFKICASVSLHLGTFMNLM